MGQTIYPTTLTTSDWVDWLEQPGQSRDEKIAALATYHRRIDYDARQSVLANVAAPDGTVSAVFASTAKALAIAIPAPVDYVPAQAVEAQAFVSIGAIATVGVEVAPPVTTLAQPSA